jgi:hypothetical protein
VGTLIGLVHMYGWFANTSEEIKNILNAKAFNDAQLEKEVLKAA